MSVSGKYKDKNGTTRVGDSLRWLAKNGKKFSPQLLDLAASVTGIKQLSALGDAIKGDKDLTPEDKDLLIMQLQYDMQLETEISRRWEADLHSDSWASKNIRPYTLAFLLVCMFLFIMLDSSLEGFKIAPEWIGLLQALLVTAVGGYFVVRSGEKIINKVKNKT